jgi:hypothetical protein
MVSLVLIMFHVFVHRDTIVQVTKRPFVVYHIRDSCGFCSQILDVRDRSNGHDPSRIDRRVRPVIMCLDVFEVCGILERRAIPIQLFHPAVQMW